MEPRMLLILCEGGTEKRYFDSLVQHKRIRMVPIEVFGRKGQHKALIDKCVSKRKEKTKEYELIESEIEVWAVCDCDKKKINYLKLLQYSESKNVKLAFSNPQFETYLLQHFEAKGTKKRKEELILELEKHLHKKYNKNDLSWFDEMIDKDPKIIEVAISNSNKLGNHTRPPFLTIQKLTERLLEFGR